jgi:hypothetical protein
VGSLRKSLESEFYKEMDFCALPVEAGVHSRLESLDVVDLTTAWSPGRTVSIDIQGWGTDGRMCNVVEPKSNVVEVLLESYVWVKVKAGNIKVMLKSRLLSIRSHSFWGGATGLFVQFLVVHRHGEGGVMPVAMTPLLTDPALPRHSPG